MNRAELQDRIDHCRRELQWLADVKTDCTRCSQYDEKGNHCNQYKADVPANFIMHGCEFWDFDEVPF